MDEILLKAMLSSPRAPSACAKACDSDEPLRPSPGPAAPRVSRSCAAASFLGTPLRVAFSSSRLVKPDRHYCRERGLARGLFSIAEYTFRRAPVAVRVAQYLAP